VRGRDGDDGIVATALHVVRDVAAADLQASFFIVASISLLSIFPAARLPKYVPGELSAEDIVTETNEPDAT
jgi:hypothetical protein